MQYNLKRLRESFGVSRTLLSKITGIPYRTLQNWELGTRKIADYEYKNIRYRLSERKELLKIIMSEPIKVEEDNCSADWFMDKRGYGFKACIFGNHYKVYSKVEVCYNALTVVPIWAKWTIEELIDEEKWKEVTRREFI
ncbi:hypothetical protein P261_00555 [Lachnospiraceae bacterium TWA4]|nr:hypothetical protein P261_00555 [Lachnospiraceae bacterium TWA4]